MPWWRRESTGPPSRSTPTSSQQRGTELARRTRCGRLSRPATSQTGANADMRAPPAVKHLHSTNCGSTRQISTAQPPTGRSRRLSPLAAVIPCEPWRLGGIGGRFASSRGRGAWGRCASPTGVRTPTTPTETWDVRALSSTDVARGAALVACSLDGLVAPVRLGGRVVQGQCHGEGGAVACEEDPGGSVGEFDSWSRAADYAVVCWSPTAPAVRRKSPDQGSQSPVGLLPPVVSRGRRRFCCAANRVAASRVGAQQCSAWRCARTRAANSGASARSSASGSEYEVRRALKYLTCSRMT